MSKNEDGALNSKDYHDYVFKEGKLIGEFELMYRNSENVPWYQDETAYRHFVDIDIAVMNFFFNSLSKNEEFNFLDLGCGLGYITNRLKQELKISNNVLFYGCDISREAVNKANTLFSDSINFFVLDLLKKNINHERKYNIIYMKDIIWYVLKEIDFFIENLLSLLSENGRIYIMQSFPDRERYYGKDKFPNAESMIEFLSRYFSPIYTSVTLERDFLYPKKIYNSDIFARFLGLKKSNS